MNSAASEKTETEKRKRVTRGKEGPRGGGVFFIIL